MSAELLQRIVAASCWHVSAGGVTAPSFLLAFGARIPRSFPLNSPFQPEEFRQYRGEMELLVWSSWRLQTVTDILASSDQGDIGLVRLPTLIGLSVVEVSAAPPAWDLFLEFSNGIRLLTFSDHVSPDASIDQNWELWVDGRHLQAGPGATLLEV
jgi:hypothetical protein